MENNLVSLVFAVDLKSDRFISLFSPNLGYKLPGGKVEKDETSAQTAVRKFKEETGIIIKENVLIPLYSGTHGIIANDQRNYWIVTYLHIIDIDDNFIINSHESTNISLEPLESLLHSIWFEYNKKLLLKYYSFREIMDHNVIH